MSATGAGHGSVAAVPWLQVTPALSPPAQGVLDRFSQIQPKLLFSVEAVVYNSKEHSHMEKLQQVTKGAWVQRPWPRCTAAETCPQPRPVTWCSLSPPGLPDLRKVVVIPYINSRDKIDLTKIPNR